MPHRAGHSLVSEFGFPQSWEMASQAIPGFMSPEKYRQIGRGLLDYVPGVSTALNWGEMGPWGRAGSVGLDALDLLTAGGGKPLTASLRGLMNLAKYNPFDPKLISWRGGLPPVDEFGNYTVSTSNLTGEPLEGVSAFQGAQFPFGRGTVIRPAINEYKTYTHLVDPELTLPLSSPLRSLKSGEQYRLNPLHTQYGFLKQRPEEMYRITGDVMPGVKGGDLESLVKASTISDVTRMPFSEFKHITGPFSGLDDYTKAVNQFTGMPFASPRMTKKALNLFSKYDEQGTPLPINPQFQNAVARWANRTNLSSTLPYTTAGRGFDWNEGDFNFAWNTPGLFGGAPPSGPYQTPFNLEEQYLRQAGRRGNGSPGG